VAERKPANRATQKSRRTAAGLAGRGLTVFAREAGLEAVRVRVGFFIVFIFVLLELRELFVRLAFAVLPLDLTLVLLLFLAAGLFLSLGLAFEEDPEDFTLILLPGFTPRRHDQLDNNTNRAPNISGEDH